MSLHKQAQGMSPTKKLGFILIRIIEALISWVLEKERRQLPIEMAELIPMMVQSFKVIKIARSSKEGMKTLKSSPQLK